MSIALGGRSRGRPPGLRDGLMAFCVAFVVMLAAALLAGSKPFIYDAAVYWGLPDLFTVDGNWSLFNFSNGLRGYVPALFYYGAREVTDVFGADPASASAVVKVLNAGLLSLIGTVLAPALASVAWPQARFGLGRRLIVAALLLLFWRGYLNFPLSDIPALAFAMLALLAVARSRAPLALLGAGLALAVAIDFRPAYILLAPAAVALIALDWRSPARRPTVRRGTFGLALLAVGIAVVLVPQALITHKFFGTYSPLPGAPSNLTGFQLTVGLKLQRYETFVGAGRQPQMNYVDPNTAALNADLGPGGTVAGYGDYAELALRHPLVIAGVFGRHLINGLDQRYSTPYVEVLDTGGQRPLRLAGLLLAFFALLRLAWPAARRGLGSPSRWGYPVALALTCATTLPSAMETRFLLPLFTLFAMLVVSPGWPPRAGLRATGTGWRRLTTPVAITISLLVFLALTVWVTSATTSNLRLT